VDAENVNKCLKRQTYLVPSNGGI